MIARAGEAAMGGSWTSRGWLAGGAGTVAGP